MVEIFVCINASQVVYLCDLCWYERSNQTSLCTARYNLNQQGEQITFLKDVKLIFA